VAALSAVERPRRRGLLLVGLEPGVEHAVAAEAESSGPAGARWALATAGTSAATASSRIRSGRLGIEAGI